ncbi:MAG: DUF1569 domain-containing protein [bacterium]|nr:DUF1569 domain-containing protein [bacterium]
MAKPALTRENWPLFRQRFDRINADSVPQWGTLTPARLMKHLQVAIESSLGRVKIKDQSTWFSRNVIKPLIVNVFTNWPKGVKAPDILFPDAENDFDAERGRLYALVDEYFAEVDRDPLRITHHPFFGPMTMRYGQRLHGLHFNHHLRQYGV